MDKQQILDRLTRAYNACVEYEENPDVYFVGAYNYGRLKECVHSILDSEKELIKDDLRGIFINRKI